MTADDRKALRDHLATLPQGEGRSLGSLVTTLLQAGYGLRFVRVTNDFNLRMVESLGCELIAVLLYRSPRKRGCI